MSSRDMVVRFVRLRRERLRGNDAGVAAAGAVAVSLLCSDVESSLVALALVRLRLISFVWCCSTCTIRFAIVIVVLHRSPINGNKCCFVFAFIDDDIDIDDMDNNRRCIEREVVAVVVVILRSVLDAEIIIIDDVAANFSSDTLLNTVAIIVLAPVD